MKIGVIGSGEVGQTLAKGFITHGHDVTIGTSHPEKLADWSRENPKARIASFRETAEFGEAIVLAVKGAAALDAVKLATPDALAGKAIMDTTNPIGGPPVKGVLPYFTGLNESLMEQLQNAAPGAHFVKAFNSVGAARMVNPEMQGGPPTMFICGNDADAKASVRSLLGQLGWDTCDMGAVEAARAIEPLAILWCIPGFLHDEWTHAFKLLH